MTKYDWQKEYLDSYREYLEDFGRLKMKNRKPISFSQWVAFYSMGLLLKSNKEKIYEK